MGKEKYFAHQGSRLEFFFSSLSTSKFDGFSALCEAIPAAKSTPTAMRVKRRVNHGRIASSLTNQKVASVVSVE